jgi:hypothetical protein
MSDRTDQFAAMREFAYILKPAFDRSFLEHATEEQHTVFAEPSAWLEARHADGRGLFAGLCDGRSAAPAVRARPAPFGIVVLTGRE